MNHPENHNPNNNDTNNTSPVIDPNGPQIELLTPHAHHLTRMKAQGKSSADLLDWLRGQGIHIHGGNLAAFWRHQQNPAQNAKSTPVADPITRSSACPPEPLRTREVDLSSVGPAEVDGHSGIGGQSGFGPSAARIAANRLNAQKSTGPKTTAGKAASSQNARKHTALARGLLVSTRDHQESDSDFQALCAEYHAGLQPVGPLEEILVEKIVTAVWRQRRARQAEAGEIALNLNICAKKAPMNAGTEPSSKAPSLEEEHLAVLLEFAGLFHPDNVHDLLSVTAPGCEYLVKHLRQARDTVQRERVLTSSTFQTLDAALHQCAQSLTDPLRQLLTNLETNPENLHPDALAQKHLEDVLCYLDRKIGHYENLLTEKLKSAESAAGDRARQDAALLPSSHTLQKILHYETVLDRQLFRAMDQLTTLQARRLNKPDPESIRGSDPLAGSDV